MTDTPDAAPTEESDARYRRTLALILAMLKDDRETVEVLLTEAACTRTEAAEHLRAMTLAAIRFSGYPPETLAAAVETVLQEQ